MSQKEDQEKEPLTDWQKRHLEFLQKKEKEAEEKEKARQEELAKRLAQDEKVAYDNLSQKERKELEKHKKREEKLREKALKLKQKRLKRSNGVSYQSLLKAIPILIFSFLVLMVTLFTLSPYGQYKVIQVKGQHYATESELLQATEVKRSDYILSTIFAKSRIEQRVKANSPWVKSAKWRYHPFNRFTLTVEEEPVRAYIETDQGYLALLADGVLAGPLAQELLPEHYTLFKGLDAKQSSLLASQLNQLTEQQRDNIQTIELTPSKASADLVTLTLADSNSIKVPLKDLAKKYPYYEKLVAKLTPPTLVDMEVGIYTTGEGDAVSSSTQEAATQTPVTATTAEEEALTQSQ